MKKQIAFALSLLLVMGNTFTPIYAQDSFESEAESMPFEEVESTALTETISISTTEQLLAILNTPYADIEQTKGKTYVLEHDFTIDPSDYIDQERGFAGNIEGNHHTITISSDANQPLFHRLRGSVKDLNLVYQANVKGAPFAYDVGYDKEDEPITLDNLSIMVKGDVLYGDHDYLQYYGKNLTGSTGYGNWYINFNGQPVHLATGFAWYLWGASATNIDIQVQGCIGQTEAIEGDALAAGFAFFALKGTQVNAIQLSHIAIDVQNDIVTNTGTGHAQSYGFAAGTTDRQMLGGYFPDEVGNITISTPNILATSNMGASTAMGFAKDMQGETHDCKVHVDQQIRAINNAPNAQLEKDWGTVICNGESYSSGFTSIAWSHIRQLRDFYHNEVVVGDIYSETKSTSKNSNSSATSQGFANQLIASNETCPNVSYHNNKVIVKNNIYAHSDAGSAVATGFVSSTSRDENANEDHIHSNSVEVQGSIQAISEQADATATGYGYNSHTHIRNCHVDVKEDIIAQSPVQAIAAGLIGMQTLGYHHFVKDCTVSVEGKIHAIQATPNGEAYAGGLIGAIFHQTYAHFNPAIISGNTVKVMQGVSTEGENENKRLKGLLIGLNLHQDIQKVAIELDNNTYEGKESLNQAEKTSTDFTNSVNPTVYQSASGNRVLFYRDNQCPYQADITLDVEPSKPSETDIWRLSNIDVLHQISTEYTKDETHHWHECRCPEQFDREPHTFEWIIDRKPTTTQTGLKHEQCTVCGYQKAGVEIPMEGSGSGSGSGSSSSSGMGQRPLYPVYRAYNPNSGEHFYTLNEKEFKYIVNIGWNDEGIAFMAAGKTSCPGLCRPLYRVYNPNSGLHHYTIDEHERDVLISLGWHDEDVAWYVSTRPMQDPVYRLYNPNDGHHLYTMDEHEKDVLDAIGWNYEGLAFRTEPVQTKKDR